MHLSDSSFHLAIISFKTGWCSSLSASNLQPHAILSGLDMLVIGQSMMEGETSVEEQGEVSWQGEGSLSGCSLLRIVSQPASAQH